MDRRVRAVKKDRKGNIIALCNAGESWSPRRTADVVKDIKHNERSYYIQEVGRRSYIRLHDKGVLQTKQDAATENSLSNLPTC
jgi:hypothetical protein